MSNGVTFTVRSPKFKVGDYVKWEDVYGYVNAGTGRIIEIFVQNLSLSVDKNGQRSSLYGWAYVIEDSKGKRIRNEAPESELSYLLTEEFMINLVKDFGITIDKDKFCLASYERDLDIISKGKLTITGYIK